MVGISHIPAITGVMNVQCINASTTQGNLPYICYKQKDLKLPINWPAVLIFDNFKGQCTSELLTLLDDNSINVTLIPPNCTDRLQPLGLSVNKAAKEFLRRKFHE